MIDLVVMRLTDMHRVHPEQDNSHVCAKCGEQVGIYPSGQAVLKARANDIRILCSHCVAHPSVGILVRGAMEEPTQSVAAIRGKPV
jgi:hypothetical protein